MTIRHTARTAALLRPLRELYRRNIIHPRILAAAPPRALVRFGENEIVIESGTVQTANTLARHTRNGLLIYEPEETRHFLSLLDDSSVVFDIGSHIGYYALVAATANQSAEVYAFELLPSFALEIERHAAANGLSDRIHVVRQPIGRTGDTIEYESFAEYGAEVAISIDDFCLLRAVHPKFIKMDIEGFELEALEGAVATFSDHRPRLLLSYHPPMIRSRGRDPQRVLKTILDYDYEVRTTEGKVIGTPAEAPDSLCSFVCLPR